MKYQVLSCSNDLREIGFTMTFYLPQLLIINRYPFNASFAGGFDKIRLTGNMLTIILTR